MDNTFKLLVVMEVEIAAAAPDDAMKSFWAHPPVLSQTARFPIEILQISGDDGFLSRAGSGTFGGWGLTTAEEPDGEPQYVILARRGTKVTCVIGPFGSFNLAQDYLDRSNTELDCEIEILVHPVGPPEEDADLHP